MFSSDPLRRAGVKLGPGQHLCKEDKLLLRGIFKHRQMFVLTDPHKPDHPIVFASKQFCEFTGYRVDEIVGRNCRFLQDEQHRNQPGLVRVREMLKNPTKEPVCVCLQNRKKNGTPFFNQFFMAPLYNKTGQVVLFVGVQHQVFELREGQESSNAGFLIHTNLTKKYSHD